MSSLVGFGTFSKSLNASETEVDRTPQQGSQLRIRDEALKCRLEKKTSLQFDKRGRCCHKPVFHVQWGVNYIFLSNSLMCVPSMPGITC